MPYSFVLKTFRQFIITVFIGIALLISASSHAQYYKGLRAYYDTTYFSAVFGEQKTYRIYLPDGYDSSDLRYPVIYYFHGWGGRYNKDDNANLEYNKIKRIADKYQLMLVMIDGNIDTLEPRPYNVGYHNDIKFQVQMKDYFPEIISHIDSAYRTLSDREHRGIIGFSMGGFMSFYLAGKYPDKISSAVSFAGSPEFFVGYPGDHSLYSNRYIFNNLRQVNLALRNGSADILYYLNSEVYAGSLWDEAVKLQYWRFPGGHMIDEPGETKAFEQAVKFIAKTFYSLAVIHKTPVQTWSHYDLYPTFKVWDYEVTTNKNEPGFILMKNVDKKGFGFCTNRWLPDGPSLDSLHADVTTAPIYNPGKNYKLLDYNKTNNEIALDSITADNKGTINLHLTKGNHEIGIFTPEDSAEFVVLNYGISFTKDSGKQSLYLRNIQNNQLYIKLLNRGGDKNLQGRITVKITAIDSSVHIENSALTLKVIPGQRIIQLPPFTIACFKKPPLHAEPASIRFHVTINSYAGKNYDEFTAPVFFDVPQFNNIKADDGVLIRDSVYGNGNADGVINPGEKIMLYKGSFNRLRLYTEDSFVVNKDERLADEIIPARSPDGYTLSSVIRISPDCPAGHEIEFLASYETKSFNPIERKLHWGRVKITVQANNSYNFFPVAGEAQLKLSSYIHK